jgi:sensor histidine kinase regulating citrate/malate metabolism
MGKLFEISHTANNALEDVQQLSQYFSQIQIMVSKLRDRSHEFSIYTISQIDDLQREWQDIRTSLDYLTKRLSEKVSAHHLKKSSNDC